MSTLPSRNSAFATAPMQELVDVLLRQFRRPLANFDIELTPTQVEQIAQDVANRAPLSEKASDVRDGLVRAVAESEAVLARWELTFQQALQTEMGDIPGWETTAEFLELANEKSNAELRIAAGSALVLVLGDERYGAYLHFLVKHPHLDDVNAIVARRVLNFVQQGKTG